MEMYPFTKVVRKRKRLAPVVKWTESDIRKILAFMRTCKTKVETPTAKTYYSKLLQNCKLSKPYKWSHVYNKMRVLRKKYRKALEWKTNIGDAMFTGDTDENYTAALNSICPFFDDVGAIWGEKIRMEAVTVDPLAENDEPTVDFNPADDTDISNETSIALKCQKHNDAELVKEIRRKKKRKEVERRKYLKRRERRMAEEEREEKEGKPYSFNDEGYSNSTILTILHEFQRYKSERSKDKWEFEKKLREEHAKFTIEHQRETLEFEKRKHDDQINLEKQKISEDYRLRELELSKKYQLLEFELKLKCAPVSNLTGYQG